MMQGCFRIGVFYENTAVRVRTGMVNSQIKAEENTVIQSAMKPDVD
jgi:hypothetical protein